MGFGTEEAPHAGSCGSDRGAEPVRPRRSGSGEGRQNDQGSSEEREDPQTVAKPPTSLRTGPQAVSEGARLSYLPLRGVLVARSAVLVHIPDRAGR